MRSVRSVEVIQKEIEDRFAELAEAALADLTDGEVTECVVRSQRLRSLVDAHCAAAAGTLESSQAWVADRARSASAWIAWRCRVKRSRASAALSLARALRTMPTTETALLAGEVTSDHARLLADAQAVNPAAFADGGEALLLEAAGAMLFSQFEQVVRYWKYRAAPDDAEKRAEQRYASRHLQVSSALEGMIAIDGMGDPIGGGIFRRELEHREQQLFEADLAEARERLGRVAALSELARTPAQRRFDALVVMAERSAAKPPGAVEPRILLQVLVGHESVLRMCELTSGQVVTPGELVRVLHRADAERIIFESPSRVLDVGVRQRFFTGATRTAVEVRDRQCVHESCDVPAERCEIDHLRPYIPDGLTTQANGACKCKYHHRRAPRGP
jgi:hypothetical protein